MQHAAEPYLSIYAAAGRYGSTCRHRNVDLAVAIDHVGSTAVIG